MPPSLCITTFETVFHTGRAALSLVCTTLLISSQIRVFCGVTVPLAVGCVIPGHHRSDPYMATVTIYESTTLTREPGVAPYFTGFSRLMFGNFERFPTPCSYVVLEIKTWIEVHPKLSSMFCQVNQSLHDIYSSEIFVTSSIELHYL